MRIFFKGLLLAGVVVFLVAPPPASAGTVEEELKSLDQKIQSGEAGPADVQRYNDLLQTLRNQGRLAIETPRFKKVRFNIPGRSALMMESGFGGITTQAVTAAAVTQSTCSEFKNSSYDCTTLPWDAADAWTLSGDGGGVSVRTCNPDDACVSDGVLTIDGKASPFIYRVEEGLATERFASVGFRMRQAITEKTPEPGGKLYGAGFVWIDDGVKSAVVAFAEDYDGNKVVIIPIVGHPDPETGELNVTEVMTAYHDWAAWHEYRLLEDKGGMIELLVDNDPVPVLSYPYESLDMGTIGGPAMIYGSLIDGENSRVTFELDYLDYSVGMSNMDGCTSGDGKIELLSLVNVGKMFDPGYESNYVTGVVRLQSIEGLGSNTQSHTFFIRSTRKIKDAEGTVVRVTIDNVPIGPAGSGKSSGEIIALATSTWDGRDSAGQAVQFGQYTYSLTIEVVRADKKQKEKTIATIGATGSTTVNDVCGGNGYRRFVWNPTLRLIIPAGCNCYTSYVERGLICTIPFDYDGTFVFNHNYLGSALSKPKELFRTSKTPWAGWWWPSRDDSINERWPDTTASPAVKYQNAYNSADPNGRSVPDAVSEDNGERSCYPCEPNSGICDSFSNAAVFEAEPRHSVIINNIEFTIDDIKALTAYLYTKRYTYAFEGRLGFSNITPGMFHTIMTNMIGIKREAIRIDMDAGYNHPFFAYKILSRNTVEWHTNGVPAKILIVAKAYFVDYNAHPVNNQVTSDIINNSVHRIPNTTEWEIYSSGYHVTQDYNYYLLINEKGIIQRGGQWTGEFPTSAERSKKLSLPPPDTIVSGIRWRHVLQLLGLSQ